jgi:hypothetical protein
MFIKVFLLSFGLMVLVVFAFAIKLFFNKNAKLPESSCHAANSLSREFACGCRGGVCINEPKGPLN